MTLREVSDRHIADVLRRHGGNKAAAAQELGVSLKTVYNRLPVLQELQLWVKPSRSDSELKGTKS